MRTRTQVGLVATVLWILAGQAMLAWKSRLIADMSPTEWGDFLSGIVAPIAFLWLIMGYFQQGEELRQNTEALKLQQEELRQQVKETAALVRETEKQLRQARKCLHL